MLQFMGLQSLPQAELFVRQRERPGLPSQAGAWPPRLSTCLFQHLLSVLHHLPVCFPSSNIVLIHLIGCRLRPEPSGGSAARRLGCEPGVQASARLRLSSRSGIPAEAVSPGHPPAAPPRIDGGEEEYAEPSHPPPPLALLKGAPFPKAGERGVSSPRPPTPTPAPSTRRDREAGPGASEGSRLSPDSPPAGGPSLRVRSPRSWRVGAGGAARADSHCPPPGWAPRSREGAPRERVGQARARSEQEALSRGRGGAGRALRGANFPTSCEGKLGVALESLQGRRDRTYPCAWRGGARPGSRVTGGD